MGKTDTPTEADVEEHPDAVAGRALLEERLERFSAEDVQAFRETVSRCFASATISRREGAD